MCSLVCAWHGDVSRPSTHTFPVRYSGYNIINFAKIGCAVTLLVGRLCRRHGDAVTPILQSRLRHSSIPRGLWGVDVA